MDTELAEIIHAGKTKHMLSELGLGRKERGTLTQILGDEFVTAVHDEDTSDIELDVVLLLLVLEEVKWGPAWDEEKCPEFQLPLYREMLWSLGILWGLVSNQLTFGGKWHVHFRAGNKVDHKQFPPLLEIDMSPNLLGYMSFKMHIRRPPKKNHSFASQLSIYSSGMANRHAGPKELTFPNSAVIPCTFQGDVQF